MFESQIKFLPCIQIDQASASPSSMTLMPALSLAVLPGIEETFFADRAMLLGRRFHVGLNYPCIRKIAA